MLLKTAGMSLRATGGSEAISEIASSAAPPRNDTVAELLAWARRELAGLDPEEATASAERLLEKVLGLERAFLYLNAETSVQHKKAHAYRRLVFKRKARVPVAYLLKKISFWEEVLEVGPGCLIPRPETEILVDSFIRHSGFQKQSGFSFLDLGSGSGAIGIALLKYFPKARGTFSDISRKALGVTRRNLKRYELLNRAVVVQSDLFESTFFVAPECFSRGPKGLRSPTKAFGDDLQSHSRMTVNTHPGRKWDAILSNPPYVVRKDLAGLAPELKFEPALALDGGSDGLLFYRKIIREAEPFLVPRGLLVLEMGAGQVPEIRSLISQNGFTGVKIFKDYSGIERVILARTDCSTGFQ